MLDDVHGAAPGGADLRAPSPPGAEPSPIQRLRRLANEARSTDRRSAETAEPGAAPAVSRGWDEVSELGCRILVDLSKDLEAAVCLCEAWLRLSGLPGLQAGLALLAGLVQRHWPVLHPMPAADGGTEARMQLLRSLDNADRGLLQRLRLTPVVSAGLPRGLSLWDLQQVERLQGLPADERGRALDRAKLPAPEEMRAAFEDATEGLRSAQAEAAAALAAAQALGDALQRQGERMPIPTLLEVLSDIAVRLRTFAGWLPAPLPDPETETGEPRLPEPVPPTAFDRERALARLSEISAQFRRTEPHSPVSYLVDQAVRWGRMPLPELLAELLPKGDARDTVFRMAGLPRREG